MGCFHSAVGALLHDGVSNGSFFVFCGDFGCICDSKCGTLYMVEKEGNNYFCQFISVKSEREAL